MSEDDARPGEGGNGASGKLERRSGRAEAGCRRSCRTGRGTCGRTSERQFSKDKSAEVRTRGLAQYCSGQVWRWPEEAGSSGSMAPIAVTGWVVVSRVDGALSWVVWCS